jgi:hypothetical protein
LPTVVTGRFLASRVVDVAVEATAGRPPDLEARLHQPFVNGSFRTSDLPVRVSRATKRRVTGTEPKALFGLTS